MVIRKVAIQIKRGNAPASGRGMAGAGRRVAEAFLIQYFSGELCPPVKAIFSGRGKTIKSFLCAILCDMKMDG